MISVIIPVYNVEKYLFICLNSVLRQTYHDFEIICIDDASSDSSLNILNYFSKKDSRIKIVQNETNRGPGFNRNLGLESVNGKYISFLDGDGFLSSNALEILTKKAESDNLDVLMFKNIVLYDENQDFGMEFYYEMKFMDEFENQVFTHWDLDKTKLFEMSNAHWNKFYLKSFLDENSIRFPNENFIHEDNPFFYNAITSAQRVSIVNQYIHNRRRRQGSIMILTNGRLFDNIEIAKIVFDYFFKKHELYEYYKKELLTHIFRILFNTKYRQIDNTLKKEFCGKVQNACNVFCEKYSIYNDIIEIVNPDILDFFKFDELRCDDD